MPKLMTPKSGGQSKRVNVRGTDRKRGNVKVFVWDDLSECSSNYHSGGGVVVFAESEDRARELANSQPGCQIRSEEKPKDVRDVASGEEAVYYPGKQ
jgi:hypothetical protein